MADMITFRAVVFAHHKRSDGTYPVKIRVTFRRQTRYIPTTITCTAADLTRSLRINGADVVARCNELCDRLRREAASLNAFDLEGRDVDYAVRLLMERMRAQDFRLDFFEWADAFLRTKSAGNRLKYDTALRAFARFLGRRSIDVNDITHALLVRFAEACDSGPKLAYSWHTGGVVRTARPRVNPISPHYLSKLSHIYDAAKDRYNDEDGGAVVIPRSPFRKLNMTPPPPRTAQKAQTVEVLQAMLDTPVDDPCRRALDVFLVSFGLMGVNCADLWEATPPKGRKWVYFRRKVRGRRADGARMEVAVPPVLGPLLARLGAGTSSAWWLPVLRGLGKDPSVAGQTVNRGLRRWCEARGLEPFTLYAARHTWATTARRIGIEKALVDEALGHVGDYRITDIYAERSWDRMAEANAKVLALLRWPDR